MASSGGSWDRVRQVFAEQFEQDGTYFIYRRSQTGEAIRVSAEERTKFIDEYDRNIRRSRWILYVGLMLFLGGLVTVSLFRRLELPEVAIFAGIGLVMLPYLAYMWWAWAAPARELASRTPFARERSTDEVRRLRLQRLTYGQLASAAFAGLAVPFIGSSRQDVFSGWNRLWLAFGAALLLLAAVQAFRKWRFDQEESCRNVIPRSSAADITGPIAESASSPSKGQLWRYIPLALLALGLAFIALTPAGKQFAQRPSFLPMLMIGCGGWALATVTWGLAKGRIEPFVRGFYGTYEREMQPKRFWASIAWNAIFGGGCLWLAFVMTRDSLAQSVQDRCYNQHDELSAQTSFEACTQLIEGRARLTYLTKEDAYVYRAIAAEDLRDRDRALADYTQAIALKPTDDYAYLHRGLIFLDAMRSDEAAADFTHAHEIDPKSPWPLADRGMAYAWKNDTARAEADFAAVRAIDPKNIVVLRGQGVLAMNAGKLESAVDSFTAALHQDPSDAWSIQMRADAYQQTGEFENARADRARLAQLSKR